MNDRVKPGSQYASLGWAQQSGSSSPKPARGLPRSRQAESMHFTPAIMSCLQSILPRFLKPAGQLPHETRHFLLPLKYLAVHLRALWQPPLFFAHGPVTFCLQPFAPLLVKPAGQLPHVAFPPLLVHLRFLSQPPLFVLHGSATLLQLFTPLLT